MFLEILTVCCNLHPHEFEDFRRGDGPGDSFRGNLDRIAVWTDTRVISTPKYAPPWMINIILEMVQYDPKQRPTAEQIEARITSYDDDRSPVFWNG